MILWLMMTVMITAAAVCLTVPLVRRFDHRCDDGASALAVYRDQLQEVERDLCEGAINDTQAETARIEVKRRILAADRSSQVNISTPSARERSFVLVAAAGIVVLGSVGLYAVTGRPDLASGTRPLRADAGEDAVTILSAATLGHPTGGLAAAGAMRSSDAEASSKAGLPSVEEMTARLVARLSQHPDDIEGWRTLGWSYLNLGRFSEATAAYAKAIKLDPANAELRGDRIEAMVESANGAVTAEAKTAIAEALGLDPRNARARFFEGLSKEQDGDKAAALAEWTELLKVADPEQGWVADLKTRMSELRHDMGIGDAAASDRPEPAIAGFSSKPSPGRATALPTERGPTAEDARAGEAMSPDDRSAMIRGMVDGLASRLEQSPRDADGWIKLIRARSVLGESDLAKQALVRSLQVFADEAAERDRIAASARQLGLAP
jgi:cytochrome c-type biogenesis protein CcmH